MSLIAITGKMLDSYGDVDPESRERILSMLQQIRDQAFEEAAARLEAYHSTISHSIDIRCAAAAIRALKEAG